MVDNLVPVEAFSAAVQGSDAAPWGPSTRLLAALNAAAPLILAAELERQRKRLTRIIDDLEACVPMEVLKGQISAYVGERNYLRSRASELRSLSTKEAPDVD